MHCGGPPTWSGQSCSHGFTKNLLKAPVRKIHLTFLCGVPLSRLRVCQFSLYPCVSWPWDTICKYSIVWPLWPQLLWPASYGKGEVRVTCQSPNKLGTMVCEWSRRYLWVTRDEINTCCHFCWKANGKCHLISEHWGISWSQLKSQCLEVEWHKWV